MKKLTDKILSSLLKAPLENSQMFTDISGMSIVIRAGGKKTQNAIFFKIRYRNDANERKWFTLGKFPEMSLAQARVEYALALDKVKRGENPHEVLKENEKPHEMTLGELWSAWRGVADASIAATTQKKFISAWRSHLCILKDTPLSKINNQFMMDFFKPYYEEKNYPTISRLGCMLASCMNYAVFLNKLPQNPLATLSRFLPKYEYQHLASFSYENLEQEMTDFFNAISGAPQKIQLMWHFAFYTLLRSLEFRSLRIEQVNGNYAYIKTKTLDSFKVAFSTQALQIIEYQKAHHEFPLSPYVFEGRAGGLIHDAGMRSAMFAEGYKGKMTIHGVRACGRQWLQTLPEAKESIIELCLSHVVGNRVVQAYNRSDYFEERLKLMQKWGDFVESCIGNNNHFYTQTQN